MKRVFLYAMILVISMLLMGCSSHTKSDIKDYNDDDVAAIVNDKQITIGELRFLYRDEDVLKNIKGTVKAALVMHVAKKMHLNVSDELRQPDEAITTLPSKGTSDPADKSTRAFATSQAKKLGMEPAAYYKKYQEITTEETAYLQAYTQKILGEPVDDNEKAIEKYNKEANQLLNDLVKEHEDEIEIRIQ